MYKELSNDFIKNMTVLYENEKQFGLVTVNDIYSDTIDNVMVNFTLVFFKGNKTVDELHQVLEKSVENGSVYSLPVQRGTLRLTLITTPAPATAIPPAVASRSKKIEPWIIVVVAAIGGLVFLVLVCAIIACCGRRRKKKKDVSQGYEEHTGKWIDLPHGENGNKSSKEEYAVTNSVAYMEGGPYQERAVEEKEPESNGNNTHM